MCGRRAGRPAAALSGVIGRRPAEHSANSYSPSAGIDRARVVEQFTHSGHGGCGVAAVLCTGWHRPRRRPVAAPDRPAVRAHGRGITLCGTGIHPRRHRSRSTLPFTRAGSAGPATARARRCRWRDQPGRRRPATRRSPTGDAHCTPELLAVRRQRLDHCPVVQPRVRFRARNPCRIP